MIVAGEPSGDALAARLVEEIRKLDPRISFFGCAGQKMRDAQVDAIVKADELAIVGIPAVVRGLPMFLRIFRMLINAAGELKPDAVILVDFPEFNLKMANALKKRGFKVIYYVSPQIWAWRKYRINTIRKYVDLLISILPYEKEWYSTNGIEHVEYVGHPLAGNVKPSFTKQVFCEKHKLDPMSPIVSMLPGSRKSEMARHLPIMLKTAELMFERDPSIQFLFPLASSISGDERRALIADFDTRRRNFRDSIRILVGETYEALNASDAAAVASGTATLETALIGTPMAIVYKVSKLDHTVFRRLINVEHIGLVNLIAGKRIVRELVQDDFTTQKLAEELCRLLEPNVKKHVKDELRVACATLGENANERTALAVIRFLDEAAGANLNLEN